MSLFLAFRIDDDFLDKSYGFGGAAVNVCVKTNRAVWEENIHASRKMVLG